MKSIVTSFSMKMHEAMELQEATMTVTNRSAWIVGACMAKARAQDAFTIDDVPTRQLLAALHARSGELSGHLREMILFELQKDQK